MDVTETIAKLDDLYRKGMVYMRKKFIRELRNAPQVAEKFVEYKIFTDAEKTAITSKPIRWHQKEAVFDILRMKSFIWINIVIQALQETDNEGLCPPLRMLKIRIREECPFDKGMLKRRLRNPLRQAESINVERDDARGRRLRYGQVKSNTLASDSFPLQSFSDGEDSSVSATEDDFANESVTSLHQAAFDGDVEVLEHLLASEKNPFIIDQQTKRTPLHAAVAGKNSQDALKCFNMIISRFEELWKEAGHPQDSFEQEKARFLNYRDNDGATVMHLAAMNESVEVVKQLYDQHHCNVFIKDKFGVTALEIMYDKTPEAVIHLLNGSLPTTSNHPSDGNFALEIDFRAIIGMPQNAQGNDGRLKYSETDLLAKLVHRNQACSKIILPHVIVKAFLDLKWERMKLWLYLSMAAQVRLGPLAHPKSAQVFLHLWYTGFIIQVFLIDCPYVIKGGLASNQKSGSNRTIYNYLLGDWESVEQAFSIFPYDNSRLQDCRLSTSLKLQAVFLFVIGFLFFLKELFEIFLVNSVFASGVESGQGKWITFKNGATAYLRSIENIFQLLFVVLLMLVCTIFWRVKIPDVYYSSAAVSIIIAWALILMQVGNVSGLGTYVQILGKVIKSFGILMGTYLVLIIAFSISFSIMFPNMEPFRTLPKSLARVLIMMTGELNYDETFYSDEEENRGAIGPPIPLAGHIIYTSFILLLTIILINLLIGMVVSDVQGLRGKSEVILRSIQVEQLYVMEKSLIRLRRVLFALKKVVDRILRRKRHWTETHLNIFVVDPRKVNSSDGMVVKKSIKDIADKNLQRELRSLATDLQEYTRQSLKR